VKKSSLPEKIAFVDIETTGCSLTHDKIVEIGIVRIEKNEIFSTYSSLVNPCQHLPPEIEFLTGITGKELENAPTFREIKKDIYQMLEGCVFSAHNSRFDYSFVKRSFKDQGINYRAKQFCTAKFSKALFPQYRSHGLDSLIERHNLICKNRHRAFGDAYAIYDFYQKMLKSFPEEELVNSYKKVTKTIARPINLPEKDIEKLPESPGVYIFYDKNGAPLYVGKSINIKERVLSHFSSDTNSTKEAAISRQINSIETVKTKGELGALIKESKLIKKLLPVYNRRSRHSKKLFVSFLEKNKDGYLEIVSKDTQNLSVYELENIAGIFKSKKQAKDHLAKLAKEFGLCNKLLGLEKTKGPCFGHQLEFCKGACIGKESVESYNIRLLEALGKLRIRKWPFPGPIAIKEEEENSAELFVFDKWTFVGTVKTLDDCVDFIKETTSFDLEIYKILKSFLNKSSNLKRVKQINLKYLESLNNLR
jgi:DNA polymerase-3 subunit epsilon